MLLSFPYVSSIAFLDTVFVTQCVQDKDLRPLISGCGGLPGPDECTEAPKSGPCGKGYKKTFYIYIIYKSFQTKCFGTQCGQERPETLDLCSLSQK